MTKSEEKVTSALKNLFGNPAIITFLLMNLFMGIAWGAADAYLYIYLNEELHASYELLGTAWVQFHQRFMRTFFADILVPKKYKPEI